MTTRKLVWMILAVVAALAALSPVRQAFAQDVKAVKKIDDMNRAAMADYDILEFENAKKQLSEAVMLAKKSKLEDHQVTARTHMNLGIVYGGGLNDPDQARVEFATALQIDGGVKLDAAYRTPELQKLYDEAKATVGTKPVETSGGGREPAGDDNETVTGLKHTPVDESIAGKPVVVSCKVGPDVKAKQVVLYYRPFGQEGFTPAAMRNTTGVKFEAEIPATATGADSVHYYIEAKNAAGKVTASNGNSGSPNIISLNKPSAGGGTGGPDASELDREDPLKGGGGGGGTIGGDGGDGGGTTITKRPRAKHRMFVNVLVGTGAGFITGKTESTSTQVNSGFAPSPLHVMPEIGFAVGPHMILSLLGRIGFPMGANTQGHSTAAPAGLLRFTYTLGKGEGVYVHGDAGFGFIRQTVKLQGGSQDGKVDTYATGDLLVGGGAGYIKPLGGPLRFVAEVNALLGVPVIPEIGSAKPQTGVNIDATLGFSFAF